jgi:hypothetical protein
VTARAFQNYPSISLHRPVEGYDRQMKKPIHGDELTIVYKGAVVKASCAEVMELPKRGAGAAKFTILSRTLFHNGADASLMDAGREVPVRVERVTTMGHKNMNIVSFFGTFEASETASAPAVHA